MGLSSKKQKSSATQTSTTTPSVPDYFQQPTAQMAGRIGELFSQGPAAFAPQVSGLQQQAFDAAKGLGLSDYFGQAGSALNGVRDVTADQVTGAGILDQGLEKYYNPFKDQVLNPVLGDYDYQSGLTRAAQAAQAAKGGAFRGSRYGIQEAQTEGELVRGRAATEGGLLSDMYGQATGLAEADTARRQQAALANQGANLQAGQGNQSAALQRAQQLAQLGLSEGSERRSNLELQGAMGAQQTALDAMIRQYPLEYQQQLEGLLSGLNPSLYTGQNTTGSSSQTTKESGGLLGQLAQIAAVVATKSDRRVKVGIKTLFHDWKGRRWVEFAYRWAPDVRRVGVIAQELLRTDPHAVELGADGVLRVNYGGFD